MAKAVKKTGARKANAAFMKPVTPSGALTEASGGEKESLAVRRFAPERVCY